MHNNFGWKFCVVVWKYRKKVSCRKKCLFCAINSGWPPAVYTILYTLEFTTSFWSLAAQRAKAASLGSGRERPPGRHGHATNEPAWRRGGSNPHHLWEKESHKSSKNKDHHGDDTMYVTSHWHFSKSTLDLSLWLSSPHIANPVSPYLYNPPTTTINF